MKIMHNFLLVTLLVSAHNALRADNYTTIIANTNNTSSSNQLQELDIDWSRVLTASLKGSLIGAATGIGCHYSDEYVLMVLDWLIWGAGREILVRTMMHDEKDKNPQADQDDLILNYTALQASWISYFLCKMH